MFQVSLRKTVFFYLLAALTPLYKMGLILDYICFGINIQLTSIDMSAGLISGESSSLSILHSLYLNLYSLSLKIKVGSITINFSYS